MPAWGKIAGIGVGLFGGAYLIRKLFIYSKDMTEMKEELQTVVTASVHSLKLTGLTILVNVKLQNPTSGTMKLKFPFINILYNEKMLGSSKVVDQEVVLPAHGEAEFKDITVTVPVVGLVTLSGAVIALLLKKQEVPINIEVLTPIDLGWKKYTEKKTFPINLKPPVYGG